MQVVHTRLLVNPQHMQAVPGRQTAVKDSEWIADLLWHGRLQASFIPPKPMLAEDLSLGVSAGKT